MTAPAVVPRDRMYIDGQWCQAADGRRLDLVNPSTGATIGTVPVAGDADLDRVLAAARRGFAHWREVPPAQRAAALHRVAALLRDRRDGIAAVMSEEQGKPVAEARAEVVQAADQFTWYAEESRRIYGRLIEFEPGRARLEVTRHPIGPVAAFTAWNFPASLPARKLAPAVAAGCSIVLKPAEQAPRTAMCLVDACHDAGLPPGVVNLVTGDPAHISRRLCGSGVIRKITLTGSVPVGQELIRLSAEHVVPLSLELGGHAPALVFADADVPAAAEACARAKFRNCGQVCISPTRFLVQEEVYREFLDALVVGTRKLVVGPPDRPGVDVGPLASDTRLAAVERLVSDAVAKGAAVETGGHRVADLPDGFFFQPTVLSGVRPEMAAMTEEPFGPVALVAPFRTVDDAIREANATTYGLASYLFTRSMATYHAVTGRIEAGMVGVNTLALATAEAPFGGIKRSGYGREGGTEGIDAYTYAKYVNVRFGNQELQ